MENHEIVANAFREAREKLDALLDPIPHDIPEDYPLEIPIHGFLKPEDLQLVIEEFRKAHDAIHKKDWYQWGIDFVNELIDVNPLAGVGITVALLHDGKDDDEYLGFIAASPLENIVNTRNPAALEKLRELRDTDPLVKTALKGIYFDGPGDPLDSDAPIS